jgi:hypothetical protein
MEPDMYDEPASRRYPPVPISVALSVGLLAFAVFSAGEATAAGWLDKLKGALGGADQSQSLSTKDIGSGLKEALQVGTENVVARLGKTDGFNLDPAVHIPLPGELKKVKKMLSKLGMDSMLTDLETRLNRAAEVATPKAKALFLKSIGELTMDDVMQIYQGPEDAATTYFRSKMSTPLAADMKPVVDESLASVGAVKSYESVIEQYNAIPMVPQVDADLSGYVVQKGIDGIFLYLAKEEAAIRKDPAKRTTELLQRVFGGGG